MELDMSFVYFCVFWANLDQTRLQRPCILCVFVFFLISAKKRPTHLCVFVFFGWKFRPSHTTHVFDVFLCCLIPGGYRVRHVFCVFLCFLANLVQTRSQHPCILCVFVFFLMSDKKGRAMCFVCFCVFWLKIQTKSHYSRL